MVLTQGQLKLFKLFFAMEGVYAVIAGANIGPDNLVSGNV